MYARSIRRAGAAILLASTGFLSTTTRAVAQSGDPGNLVLLTARGNFLVTVNAGTPTRPNTSVRVTGLQVGEYLLGIDYRPATGDLYALGSTRRVYTIDLPSGVATSSGAAFTSTLNGVEFGFDFNPVPDRIRVIGDTGQSLRLNPNNGALAGTDTSLAYGIGDPGFGSLPAVVAVAYTESYAGATRTTLFGIDATRDTLVRIGGPDGVPSPNGGTVTTIGALGVDAGVLCGFDVSPNGGAFAAIGVAPGVSNLYTVNLASGATALLGRLAGPLEIRDLAVIPPSKPRVFATTADNRLVSFRPGTPGVMLTNTPIVGLAAGETVLGVDFRPSTGELQALGSTNRQYRIDPTTAVALPVGSTFTPALSGVAFGFDFNPVPDRVRVVGDADQSLRLQPDTGAVAGTDTPLTFAAGDVNAGAERTVVAAAYTESYAGTTRTTLYAIDAGLDVLVRQGGIDGVPSPNGGVLTTIGPLGFDTTNDASFDVTPYGGSFAALTAPGASSSTFVTVNLATGATTSFGAIAAGAIVTGMAVEPPLQPRVLAVTTSNELVTFAPGRPGVILESRPITGLSAGENVLGIDVRPATGELYAVSSTNRLLRIQPLTGQAVPFGANTLVPALDSGSLGVDFNPIPDRLRIVSVNEQNLRANPNNGRVAGVDTTLAYDAADSGAGSDPRIVAAAYTQNFAGTTSTTLFGIDSTRDVLVRQGGVGGVPSPNGGVLSTIGSLGVDTGDLAGFDVSPRGGALAVLATGSGPQLFSLNLTTGAVTLIGAVGTTSPIVDLAISVSGL